MTDPACGRSFSAKGVAGGTSWYPANGSRRSESGNVNFGSKYIYSWNATASGTTSYYVSGSQSSVMPSNLIDYRGAAMPVRCIRE